MSTLEKVLFVLSVLGVILPAILTWFLLYWQAVPV
jgi:hypothetical protein